MDFSWLTGIFGSVIKIFSPLKNIQHWKIWAEMEKWYARFKKWRDWYKQHIMAPMQQMHKLQQQIYDQYMRPVLTLVDHIRRLTSIVGLFNHKLAEKLNYQFLKVEGYLLKPFNAITERTNALGYAVQGVLTPLGYLDRATLLNSVWRDADLIKEILRNPFNTQYPKPATAAPTTVADAADKTLIYLQTGGGEYQPAADQAYASFQQSLKEMGM